MPEARIDLDAPALRPQFRNGEVNESGPQRFALSSEAQAETGRPSEPSYFGVDNEPAVRQAFRRAILGRARADVNDRIPALRGALLALRGRGIDRHAAVRERPFGDIDALWPGRKTSRHI